MTFALPNDAFVPETVPALIEWFERHFDCFQGSRRAFFEIQTGPNNLFRGIYKTYAVLTHDEFDHERRLVDAFRKSFQPLVTQDDIGPTLFWRLPEKIVLKRSADGLLLRTRLVIPALDWLTVRPDIGLAEGAETVAI